MELAMSETVKKMGFFRRIGKFFKEVKSELKKTVWPTPKQTVNNTITVIIYVAIVGVIIFLCDMLFMWGVSEIIGLG